MFAWTVKIAAPHIPRLTGKRGTSIHFRGRNSFITVKRNAASIEHASSSSNTICASVKGQRLQSPIETGRPYTSLCLRETGTMTIYKISILEYRFFGLRNFGFFLLSEGQNLTQKISNYAKYSWLSPSNSIFTSKSSGCSKFQRGLASSNPISL